MLVNCPDCTMEISDLAPACPKCGRPMKAQTIELTGKGWKLAQLIAGVIMVAGLVWILISILDDAQPNQLAIGFATAGVLIAVGSRLGAWWYHE